MICRSSIRRFDAAASNTLHAAVMPRGASGLRFVSWATIDKGSGLYAPRTRAPGLVLAWVPQEKIRDETSSAAEIDAALADPNQIPLLVVARRTTPAGYVSDAGSPFPVVSIKGIEMVLALRVTNIAASTHGQFTFGWQEARQS